MAFRFVEHTADIALALEGVDGAELFRDAALGLTAIYVDVSACVVEALEVHSLELESEDAESLLIDFLNELIFRFDTDGFLCAAAAICRIELGSPARLEVRLEGETFDPSRHFSLTEVKAATFHDVRISSSEAGLKTVVVFDL